MFLFSTVMLIDVRTNSDVVQLQIHTAHYLTNELLYFDFESHGFTHIKIVKYKLR